MVRVITITFGMCVAGCASTHWEDVTRGGRGQSEFIMDRGKCQLVSQDASSREQLSVDIENENGCAGSPGLCATRGVLQGVNVSMAGSDAFGACMNARGWALVADSPPPKKTVARTQSRPVATLAPQIAIPPARTAYTVSSTPVPPMPAPPLGTDRLVSSTAAYASPTLNNSRIYIGPKVSEEEAKTKCREKGLRDDTYVFLQCLKGYLSN